MLRQEINLITSLAKPETDSELFTWKRFLIANVIFTVLMIILLISSVLETHRLKNKLKIAENTMMQNQEKFQQMKNKLPQFLFGDNISEAVINMNKEMAMQKKIIAILASSSHFSQNLVALSRTIIPDVWLTKIYIAKNGAIIDLEGNSIGMDNLNEYIARLNKDNLLSPYEVTIKKIGNADVKNPKAKLSFELNMEKGSNG